MAPILLSNSGSRAPGWLVSEGQCGTVTAPPVTSAAARNGAALDRSGSITWSGRSSLPGVTSQRRSDTVSTMPPADCTAVTVICTCGKDGSGPPTCRISAPWSNRGAASNSAETNCEDAEKSSSSTPPGSPPVPCTVNGSRPAPPSEIATPA